MYIFSQRHDFIHCEAVLSKLWKTLYGWYSFLAALSTYTSISSTTAENCITPGYRKLQNSTYSRLLSSGSDVPADVKVAANIPGDGSMADPAE